MSAPRGIRKGSVKGRVLELLEDGRYTDEELADLIDPSARKRRIDLVHDELVVDTGERRFTRSGDAAIVWTAISNLGAEPVAEHPWMPESYDAELALELLEFIGDTMADTHTAAALHRLRPLLSPRFLADVRAYLDADATVGTIEQRAGSEFTSSERATLFDLATPEEDAR